MQISFRFLLCCQRLLRTPVDELLEASSSVRSKANAVLTLRGDFVGRAFAYRPLSLGPVIREELEYAIRQPADEIQWSLN